MQEAMISDKIKKSLHKLSNHHTANEEIFTEVHAPPSPKQKHVPQSCCSRALLSVWHCFMLNLFMISGPSPMFNIILSQIRCLAGFSRMSNGRKWEGVGCLHVVTNIWRQHVSQSIIQASLRHDLPCLPESTEQKKNSMQFNLSAC